MTAHPTIRGEVSYALESTWAENVSTVATRLQSLGPIDISGLMQDMIELNPTVARQNEGTFGRRSVREGQFSIELELGGHGATGAGAIGATDLTTLLGYCVGNSEHAAVGAGMEAGGTNTATHLDTAGATFAAGHILRVGVKNDGRADGQPTVVSSFTDNGADEDVELLVATPAASNQSDSAFGMAHVYPNHDASVQSLRFLLATANARIWCRGCFCTAIEFLGVNPGEHPRVKLTFGVSYWEYEASTTFPSANNTDAKVGAPVTAGSYFENAVGTATRVTKAIRQVDLAIDMLVTPNRSHDGVFEFQSITGARRHHCKASLEIVVDAPAASATPEPWNYWNTAEGSIVARHVLMGMSTGDQRSIAFYFPNMKPMGPAPRQEDLDGLNRVRLRLEALTSAVTTNDLTLSNWRLGVG